MEALELASWPQMEKGRQSVMSTFEPRFGGAHFLGGGVPGFRRGRSSLAFDVRMGTFSAALSIPVRLELRVSPLKCFCVPMGPYAEFRINGNRDRPKPCQLATSG